MSGYDKALVIIHSLTGQIAKTNYIVISVDGSKVYAEDLFMGWGENKVINLKNKSKLSLSVSGEADVYIKYYKESDEENLVGGESQTVTATYTGDGTYKKPTEVKLIDGFGNTVSESYYQHGTNTLLNKNVYKYDYDGNVIEYNGGRNYMENLSDYTTKTEYDYLGNPVKEYRADGAYTTTQYNKQGQAVSATDYMGNTSTITYDQLGRTIKTETPFDGNNNAKTLTYYDKNGNITKTRQYNSSWEYTDTYFSYDKRNRLIVSRVYDGSQWVYTLYGYDNVGNVLIKAVSSTFYQNVYDSIKNEKVSYETYEYDRFGNVTKTTDADGRIETAQYNLMGLPVSATDKNGNTTAYTYNAYGSVLTQNNPSENITNTYNVNNLLTKTTSSASGTITYAYDKYGYMSRESVDGVIKSYSSDVDGNRTSMAILGTSGAEGYINTLYKYDVLNQLTQVSFDTGSGVSPVSYTYDKNGRLESETRNGITNTYTYNKAGLMTSNGEGINISYRLDGRESSRTQNGKTTYYTYDKIGQLTSERTGNVTTSYTYDGRGNRATMTVGNDMTTYEYDRTNRLMSETVSELGAAKKVTEYEYDPNGNLTFKGIGTFEKQTDDMTAEVYTTGTEDLATFYTYDAKNRLVGVNSDSSIISYTYDAAGRRNSKTVKGETTKHIWDGDNIVVDTTSVNALIAKYYRGINPVAMVTKSSGTLTPYYYHYDEKGSITKLTDKSGNTVQDYNYDAFGNLNTEDDALYNPIRYTGQYTDEETGLIYLRNRYYDPAIGRFTQEDTYWNVHNMIYGDDPESNIPDYSAIMQSGNLYVYCMSDPVNGVDFLGNVAYQRFETPDMAAEDWAWNYYAKTDFSLFEQVSIIYKVYNNGDLYYTYGYSADVIDKGDSFSMNPHNVDPYTANAYPPEVPGYTVEVYSFVHSHASGVNISSCDAAYVNSGQFASVYAAVPNPISPNLTDVYVYHDTREYGMIVQMTSQNIRYDRSYLNSDKRQVLRARYEDAWNQHLQNDRYDEYTCSSGFDCPQYRYIWPLDRWE